MQQWSNRKAAYYLADLPKQIILGRDGVHKKSALSGFYFPVGADFIPKMLRVIF